MGNAKFYYYPSPASIPYLTSVDLGEPLAELFSEFDIDAQDGVSYTGRRYRTVARIIEVIRIQRDRMIDGETKAKDLMTMQSHLDRGNGVAFASDAGKAYATYLTHPARAGDTVIRVASNQLRGIVGNQIVTANDYLMIESQNPAMRYQMVKVSSITATATASGNITLSTPILFDFATGTVGIRYYRFWPILKRPSNNTGRNMVTNEHGFLWSLDLTVVPDYYQYFDLFPPVGVGLDDNEQVFGDALTTGSDSILSFSGLTTLETARSDIGTSLITEPEIPPITVGS